jgi:hypothetical protein
VLPALVTVEVSTSPPQFAITTDFTTTKHLEMTFVLETIYPLKKTTKHYE